jgi:hypothetical protein
MLKILEKFREVTAIIAVALTLFGIMQISAEMGASTLVVGVFLLLFAELCEISAKLNK